MLFDTKRIYEWPQKKIYRRSSLFIFYISIPGTSWRCYHWRFLFITPIDCHSVASYEWCMNIEYHAQSNIRTLYNLYDDDVIKWKHFVRYWPFVRGIHRSAVNSPHKGQWRGALMFSLICAWINGCVNDGEAGDLRRHRVHYDVTVMTGLYAQKFAGHIHTE